MRGIERELRQVAGNDGLAVKDGCRGDDEDSQETDYGTGHRSGPVLHYNGILGLLLLLTG
jgi:hypothetical protein